MDSKTSTKAEVLVHFSLEAIDFLGIPGIFDPELPVLPVARPPCGAPKQLVSSAT